ncbi:MAG: outer membrane lipoprotein carrier protein LolA [Altererythrobacter sp.]|nr:outer membrane lipoprotein carrier protein LolA [Altererythrobacter sp.]OJU60651.1 MAG: cell envelope biogenesis protein LolA [Altererythrobacter sp. 66-12]
MNALSKIATTPLRLALAGALAAALPAALGFSAAPAMAQGTDALDQAVAALRGISTMKADFVQTDRTGQSVRGTLTIKRPGRIRFEYEPSAKMLVVSNGSRLTLIDYEVNQVQSWPIGSSPLSALLDPKRDVKRYGTVVPSSNPNVITIDVKDSKNGITITLIFVRDSAAPGGLQLTNWVALDAQNKRTTVRLTNQSYGMSVPDSTFTYRDPRRTSRRPG